MDTLTTILDHYGYWLLLAVGFAEYAGVPIASVPVLVSAGALAAGGGASVPAVAAAAALGGLLADAGWYGLARWQGGRLVGVACGLSSNRNACVVGVQHRVARLGARYVLSAKFLPGAGNLIAPAAGFSRFPLGRFLALDAAALALWALAYAGLGWLFSSQVEAVIELALGYTRWLLGGFALLVAGFGSWRVVKARLHRAHHAAAAQPSGEPATNPERAGRPTS